MSNIQLPKGFTPWFGGIIPPVTANCTFSVVTASGFVHSYSNEIKKLSWSHAGNSNMNIVGYKIHDEKVQDAPPATENDLKLAEPVRAEPTPPSLKDIKVLYAKVGNAEDLESFKRDWNKIKADRGFVEPAPISHLAIILDAGANYTSLALVLQRAFDQASDGKGSERHATGQPFEAQPMQTISELLGSHDGLLFQAMKKIQESQRLPHDAAVRELLGAINYISGAIIYREAKMNDKT